MAANQLVSPKRIMKEVRLNIYGQMFRGEMWCGIRRVGSLSLSGVSGERLRVEQGPGGVGGRLVRGLVTQNARGAPGSTDLRLGRSR